VSPLANASLSLVLRTGVLIARITPEIVHPDCFPTFLDEVENMMSSDRVSKLVLDLNDLSGFSTESIEKLVHFNHRLKVAGGWLRLGNVKPEAEEVLAPQLHDFNICSSLAEAIA